MILKDEKTGLPENQGSAVETPPPYTASEPQTQQQQQQTPSRSSTPNAIPSSSSSTPKPTPNLCNPPPIARCNYLTVQRQSAPLKDKFVVDPELRVPLEVYDPSEPGAKERDNLSLEVQNGHLSADIWIVGPSTPPVGEEKLKRASVSVKGEQGFVAVNLFADQTSPPFSFKLHSSNGFVSVAIPRCFVGPLTTTTVNGWVSISSTLAPNVTTFSDVKSMRKCFVGDFTASGYGHGEWMGSTIEITAQNGRLKLSYAEDEHGESKGFWGKLFGRT